MEKAIASIRGVGRQIADLASAGDYDLVAIGLITRQGEPQLRLINAHTGDMLTITAEEKKTFDGLEDFLFSQLSPKLHTATLQFLDSAPAAQPSDEEINKGNLLARKGIGSLGPAFDHWKLAAKVNPDSTVILWNSGMYFYCTGAIERAAACAETVPPLTSGVDTGLRSSISKSLAAHTQRELDAVDIRANRRCVLGGARNVNECARKFAAKERSAIFARSPPRCLEAHDG